MFYFLNFYFKTSTYINSNQVDFFKKVVWSNLYKYVILIQMLIDDINIRIEAGNGGRGAVAFDKNLSLDLAAEAARKKVATGKQLLEVKEDTLQYKVRSWDKEKGLAVVDLGFETLLAAKLDTDELAALLSNRSPEEIKNLLLQKPEIASVRIDLSPFWRKKTPKSTNRMQVRVEIKK